MSKSMRAKDEFRGMNVGRPRSSKKKKGNRCLLKLLVVVTAKSCDK